MSWLQLYIRTPAGNGYTTPQAMRRVDEHLQMLSACMHCPDKTLLPVQEQDGTWEVRVMDANQGALVKGLLKSHYGLEVEREVKHD